MSENKFKRFFRILKELVIPFRTDKWEVKQTSGLSVMSLNLRGDKEKDGVNSWINRRDSIVKMIKDKSPDIICCQETMTHMAKFLKRKIGYNYDCFGIDTFIGLRFDKTVIPTMGNIVFIKKSKYNIDEKDVFWLSDKPNYPSKTWGNSEPRNCIVVRISDINNGKTYSIFATHFDHISKEARNKSCELLISKSLAYNSNQIFFVGDFNAKISGTDLINFNNYNYFPKHDMVKSTFNGFTGNKTSICDYIITNDNLTKYKFELITDGYGVPFLSDHYPILLH